MRGGGARRKTQDVQKKGPSRATDCPSPWEVQKRGQGVWASPSAVDSVFRVKESKEAGGSRTRRRPGAAGVQ